MRRPTKPCDVGDTMTLHDRHLDADVTTLVDEVRWDSWLYGGEYRIFTPVGLYFTGRDIVGRTPDLLADLGDWSHEPREREQVMDRYQVVTLQAAVYVVDNDEMQASSFAGDWNAHASCELLNSGAMPRTDLDWIDLEPESAVQDHENGVAS